MHNTARLRGRGRHARDTRHSRGGRALRGVLVAVCSVLVLALVGGFFVYRKLNGNINAQDLSGLLGRRPSAVAPRFGSSSPLNILLMGSDTRALSDGSQYGGSANAPGQRNDTTILLHLAADRKSATLVSIPRDSIVKMPSCTLPDGSQSSSGNRQFNSAYGIGGPACVLRTVESITQIKVDHFVVVDFDGFKNMVNGLGGVTICLPKAVDDPDANLHLPAGRHVVNGEQALAYVRVRHIGDGSDLSRINRQQAFLASMVQKATSTQLLLRPDRLLAFLDAATKSLTTDAGFASLNEMRKVAQSVKNLPTQDVRFVTVPVGPYPQDPNRVEFLPAATELWNALRFDRPLGGANAANPTPSATGPALTVSPTNIRVRVLNAGAAGGSARAAATALRAQGFVVIGTGGAGGPEVSGVVVRYPQGRQEAARTLAAAFPGARTEVDADLTSSLAVDLGAGAPTAVDVPNRVPAGASASPTITARAASDDICAR